MLSFLSFNCFLDEHLPLKRIHEFAILLYLAEHETMTLDQAQYQLLKYLNAVDSASIEHAFKYLNADFF